MRQRRRTTVILLTFVQLVWSCAASEARCTHDDCLELGDAITDDGPPADPYAPRIFGPLIIDAGGLDLVFDAPGDLASFTLTLSAPSPESARLGFHELVAPDGTVLYTLGDGASLNPTLNPYAGAASIMVPTGDDPRVPPVAGTYRARIGIFETTDNVTFTPIDGDIGLATVLFEAASARGGVLSLRIAATPSSGITGGGAFLASALTEVRHYYQDLAGVTVGDPIYDALPDSFDHITEGDTVRQACAVHADLGPSNATVNVFIVSTIDFTAGLAGGVPGPVGVSHTGASCVVIEKQSTALATGALMAHEIGHFLGLFHSTLLTFDADQNQYTLGGYDALTDTPECQRGTPLESCPDYHNLMFPFFPVSGLSLSPAQIDVITRSPWLR